MEMNVYLFCLDLNINMNEYLLADRIIPKHQAKKCQTMMKTLERICNVRIIICKSLFIKRRLLISHLFSMAICEYDIHLYRWCSIETKPSSRRYSCYSILRLILVCSLALCQSFVSTG